MAWQESVLLTAVQGGSYTCDIEAQTSTGTGADSGYQMNVRPASHGGDPNGTWLEISSTDETSSQAWVYNQIYPNCETNDSTTLCHYIGGSAWPSTADLFAQPFRNIWTASNDATYVEVAGSFQITSCPSGSKSCTGAEHGGDDHSYVHSALNIDQLNPDNSVCNVTPDYGLSPGQGIYGDYWITNEVHHQPLWFFKQVPVSQNCGGSRKFAIDLSFQLLEGNPVKLDGGDFSIINYVKGTTTTVPPVTSDSLTDAETAISAAGLTAAPTYVMSPSRVGTVLSQNSPGGTVEPATSTVQLTVSNGQVIVPHLLSEDQASAEQAITNDGLTVGSVSYTNNCDDPGSVMTQDPSPGVQVSAGTAVSISVSTCNSGGTGGGGTGGTGGGGGSGGPPRQPK